MPAKLASTVANSHCTRSVSYAIEFSTSLAFVILLEHQQLYSKELILIKNILMLISNQCAELFRHLVALPLFVKYENTLNVSEVITCDYDKHITVNVHDDVHCQRLEAVYKNSTTFSARTILGQ